MKVTLRQPTTSRSITTTSGGQKNWSNFHIKDIHMRSDLLGHDFYLQSICNTLPHASLEAADQSGEN